MLTISEAFRKFRKRLEVSPSEEQDASRRQQVLRSQLRDTLAVKRDLLMGSYIRETKTKPLKDVDIFVILEDSEQSYAQGAPDQILDLLIRTLAPHYPQIGKRNRSVKVDFGIAEDADDHIFSIDVVPAFEFGRSYRIPDRRQGGWITTDPTVHADLATAANAAFSEQWKPVVKMIKKWNDYQGRPVRPAFLLEVMALKLVQPPWTGSYPRELRQFFASASESINDPWPDPAGLGPPVTARLAESPTERAAAVVALQDAEHACTRALLLEQDGRIGAALPAWQLLFGPHFAKS